MYSLLFLISYVYSQTVPAVNLTAYYGRWIQLYSDSVVVNTFEKNLVCDSAYYTPNKNNTISVVNSGNYMNAYGNISKVYGWANQPDLSQPGKLSVHLQPTGGIGAPYWIYKLGPIKENQYQYSIVSDEFKLTLFVLARNYTTFFTLYADEVLKWLFQNGFNGEINSPIPTNQTNCIYPL